MMGNNSEWVESPTSDPNYGAASSRGIRGGNWWYPYLYYWHASAHTGGNPAYEADAGGFRVASIPEPGGFTLLVCGLSAGLLRWRRRT